MKKVFLSDEEIRLITTALRDERERQEDRGLAWQFNKVLGKIRNLESDSNPHQKILREEMEA